MYMESFSSARLVFKNIASPISSLYQAECFYGEGDYAKAMELLAIYEKHHPHNPEAILLRIKEGFEAEWNSPTDLAD